MRLDGLRRVDVPEIDKGAFREAIINAFCHRNYYEDDSVNIAVFKDRLEIRSPGDLYGGLTIEQIKKEKVSKRRNEIIANMFHEVHFVEKWGRGIDLILKKEPTVDFKEVAEMFIATFKRKEIKDVPENVPENVPDRLRMIKDFMLENNKIKILELAKRLRVNEKTIKRDIEKLKDSGEIKRVGSAKGGYWEVIGKRE